MDEITDNELKQKFTKQEKVISLFMFIEELNKLKQNVVLRVSDHPWWHSISSLPDDPENIRVYYRDRVEEEDTENTNDVLLSVHKPEFQNCPNPDPIFEKWLEYGWSDYRYTARNKEFILHPLDQMQFSEDISEDIQKRIDDENHTYKEFFTDLKERVAAFRVWIEKREKWVKKQKMLAKTRVFFSELYKISIDLDRDFETLELVVADGFIQDRNMPKLDHPILTRRVKIRHDAAENTIYIMDTDIETELYTAIFQNMDGINLSSINHLRDDLHQNDYHPLDRNELPAFLKIFMHQLSSESIYAEDTIPDNWQKKERLLMYRNPCYILRRRMDGTLKAIEQIIEHIKKTGKIPAPISDLVEGGKIDIPEDIGESSIEDQLAAVGGESVDILLSKEANKEQLEIARRIERYNAVLVQGPPGTGKTHTIANLMGHFLAQGKSVLVTSHTPKALRVLKEKIAPGLQSLCVSMLDDSYVDMEKSIDGITSYMSQYTSFELKKDIEALGLERKQIIQTLADTRKKIFSILNQECNRIVYNGEDISPSEAAKFVHENSETLSYIPGKVRLYEPLPLNFTELSELYRSNEIITTEDESEFDHELPNPKDILSPNCFEEDCNSLDSAMAHLKAISENTHWRIQNLPAERKILLQAPFGLLTLAYPKAEALEQLNKYVSEFPEVEPWMQHCAIDGKKGDTYKQLWLRLIQLIQDTSAFAENLTIENFGKNVKILNEDSHFAEAMTQLFDKYSQVKKISKLSMLFNKQLETALNGAVINGQKPQNAEDCQLILHVMELKSMRDQCAVYWNDLIAKHGIPSFYDLDASEPERVAANYIPYIQRYLDWFQNEYEVLIMHMNAVNLPCDVIFQSNTLDSEMKTTEKILMALVDTLPNICSIFEVVQIIADTQNKLVQNCNILQTGKRLNSVVCKALLTAAEAYDPRTYRDAFALLEKTYAKTNLKSRRVGYLNRLSPVAPQWADAIRSRNGIHGKSVVPRDIGDAWK